MKIDLEKFICSLMKFTPVSNEVKYIINSALKDQGLEYKNGAIVEKEEELSEFEKAVYDRIKDYDIEIYSNEQILEYSKVVAHELLELARKE